MIGKFAVVFGPLTIALFCLISRKLGFSSDLSSRIGMSSVSLFFIFGAILFYYTNKVVKKESYSSRRDKSSSSEFISS